MTPVQVSVVIPTYNHAQYILETLDSVFRQSFQNYEVIVINDGSPDDTAAVLKPLAEAGKIIYLEQPNAGQATARNRGAAQARGEFVAFLDDDDLWPPDNLERQISNLRGAGGEAPASVGSCAYVSDSALTPPPPVTGDSLTFERLLHKNSIISPGQVVMRKSALLAAGGFGRARGGADDWDCWLRLAGQGRMLAGGHVALLYRVHQTNASRNAVAMLRSADEVISKHTENLPRAARTAAFRSLLDQAAIFVANQTMRALGRGDWKEAAQGGRCLLAALNKAGWSIASLGIVAKAFWDTFKATTQSKLRRK